MNLMNIIRNKMDRAKVCDNIARRAFSAESKYQGKGSVKRYYASTIEEVKSIMIEMGYDEDVISSCDHRDFADAGFGVIEAQRVINRDITREMMKRRPTSAYVWVVIGAAGAA